MNYSLLTIMNVSKKRKSVCNVDIEQGMGDCDNELIQKHNKPLKLLENACNKRAYANRKAASMYTSLYVTFILLIMLCSGLTTLFSSINIFLPAQPLAITNAIIAFLATIFSGILAKWDLGKIAGAHRERAKNFQQLTRKLKLEKYVTPLEEWGNLYYQVLRDSEEVENKSNIQLPEFLTVKSDKGSDGSIGTILSVSPALRRREESDRGLHRNESNVFQSPALSPALSPTLQPPTLQPPTLPSKLNKSPLRHLGSVRLDLRKQLEDININLDSNHTSTRRFTRQLPSPLNLSSDETSNNSGNYSGTNSSKLVRRISNIV